MRFIQAPPVIDRVMNVFRPFSGVANILQAQFGWARPPRCRLDHGRMEITVRGAQLAHQGVEDNVTLAQYIASVARPQLLALAESSRRKGRGRLDLRAISVVFEDEAIVGGGIMNVRFSYVAPPPQGVDESYTDWRGRRGR
jgi:hypothetical protein